MAGHGRMVDDPFRQRTSTKRLSASTPLRLRPRRTQGNRRGDSTRRDVTTNGTLLVLFLAALPSQGPFRSAYSPWQTHDLLPIGDASGDSR